jgi:hypothetical protein
LQYIASGFFEVPHAVEPLYSQFIFSSKKPTHMLKKFSLLLCLCALLFSGSLKAQVLKGDPWIFQVYKEVYGRQPTGWELNINNYNSGSWNNYAELKKYVQEFQTSLSNNRITIVNQKINDSKILTGFFQNGKLVAANVISPQGGNVIAVGGGNVITAGGANVVAPGGANMQISSRLAGVSFGGRYSVQSAGTTIIPASGKSALIIR